MNPTVSNRKSVVVVSFIYPIILFIKSTGDGAFPPLEHIFHLVEWLREVFFLATAWDSFLIWLKILSACHVSGIMIHGRFAQFNETATVECYKILKLLSSACRDAMHHSMKLDPVWTNDLWIDSVFVKLVPNTNRRQQNVRNTCLKIIVKRSKPKMHKKDISCWPSKIKLLLKLANTFSPLNWLQVCFLWF